MIKITRHLLPVLIVSAALLSGSAQAASPSAEAVSALSPHRATYEIHMVSRHTGSPVLDIRGKMIFEARKSCDAWTTSHSFTLKYDYAESPPLNIASDFSTYEPYDNSALDFTARRKRDGALYEEIRGHADNNDKTGGKAVFSLPDGLSFDLKPGSLFPTAHTAAVIDNIKQNKKFFNATVFDGSDDEGPVEINSFIGKPVPAAAPGLSGIDDSLNASPAWNVRMAFFPLNSNAAAADYEMDTVFHENGVIGDMLITYSDFSMTQKLVGLEKLPDQPCTPAKK